MKSLIFFMGLGICLLSSNSCVEEKQYSHREEIISEKIWREDSLKIEELFRQGSLEKLSRQVPDSALSDTIAPKTSQVP